MVNLRGDVWGTFVGDVGTTHGARLGAVYTGGDRAVVNLGEVNDICFTEPLSCNNGFTVSLWLRHRTIYSSDTTTRQGFIAIGDSQHDNYTFKVYQKVNRAEEHLAVSVSASSRTCTSTFPVPRSVWSLYAFVWNTSDLNVYRNGLKVDKFLRKYCTDEIQGASKHPTVTLKDYAVFDDFQIWNRVLSPNEIDELFTCTKGIFLHIEYVAARDHFQTQNRGI